MHPYRTHTCNELRAADAGKTVRLSGWMYRLRDHGGILFVDLRDHYGLTQIVVHPSRSFFGLVEKAHLESVVTVTGEVKLRTPDTINPDLPTGEVEIEANELTMESPSQVTPLYVPDEKADESEDVRLQYRFLDLRREKLHRNIVLRSQVIRFLREKMWEKGFNEFQTPILTASSPEGARDYLVPSRIHRGMFYALPQAPQMFKQLLMVSGFDRYFQIAPCFRDEAARADRSPGEFYQLDMEMSYATQDDVFAVMEDVIPATFREFAPAGTKIDGAPFVRIPYREAMMKYGSDKPDLRNPLVWIDMSAFFAKAGFKAFASTVEKGGLVKGLLVKGAVKQSRTWFDKREHNVKENGGKGLGYITWTDAGELKGPIAKFLTPEQLEEMKALSGMEKGDALFFMAAPVAECHRLSGLVRTDIAETMGLVEKDAFRFCWIVDFPFFETDEETGALIFSHNPFSMPQGGMDALLSKNPLDIVAYQYDIVCNGIELSSGAVRNHRTDVMLKAFELCGYPAQEVYDRFPALANAFKYGAPPHAGVAPGVDRMVMLLTGSENIREVIAFPMNQKAQEPMMNSPHPVTEKQLRELHIKVRAQNVAPNAAAPQA
ncbi:MAG: aspartate--tRNA ligase [Kiritimatiellae bacterium]|nr:aspartate--tRNA ligase [Kiritimatiellia bacterium]